MDKTLEYYDLNADNFIANTLEADVSELYTFFQSYVKPGSSILDFGCGSGRDSKYFIEQGYLVTAIDGSIELCNKASKYIEQPVECMMFEDLTCKEEFDGIWACSSILHVRDDEMPSIFLKMKEALKKKGYIYCSFKYGDYAGKRNGRYFKDFTEKTFKELIDNINELVIVETKITGDVRTGRDNEKWINIILRKI